MFTAHWMMEVPQYNKHNTKSLFSNRRTFLPQGNNKPKIIFNNYFTKPKPPVKIKACLKCNAV